MVCATRIFFEWPVLKGNRMINAMGGWGFEENEWLGVWQYNFGHPLRPMLKYKGGFEYEPKPDRKLKCIRRRKSETKRQLESAILGGGLCINRKRSKKDIIDGRMSL